VTASASRTALLTAGEASWSDPGCALFRKMGPFVVIG
jgi:hypothetical protein